MRLRTTVIFVKNLPLMSAFYREILGLTVLNETRSDDYLELDAGTIRLALHAIPDSIAAEIEIHSPAEPRADNPVKLVFETMNFAAQIARLEGLGVTVVRRSWGGCDGIDPEGNVFGISEP